MCHLKKMWITSFSHLWITSVIYIFLHLLHILSCRHTSLNGLLHIWDLIGLKITCVYKHSEKMRWCRWMCRWKKMWSHFFTSFHIFLHLFTSFYIFSHLFTSCHILPHFLNFDNIKSNLVMWNAFYMRTTSLGWVTGCGRCGGRCTRH